jgi:hypothetical protein
MPRACSPHRTPLTLERLEDRLVPSTMAGVYADGTWRYDTTADWAHISNMTASLLDVDDAGDVYGRFSDGVWRWTAATASWQKLSNFDVAQVAVTASGIFYGEFSGQGVWRWSPSTGWMHLTNLDSGLLAVSDSDTLFGRFDTGTPGTWRWTVASGWSLLTASRPDILQTDAAGDMAAVYASSVAVTQKGTWRWSPTTGWAHLSSAAPFNMLMSTSGAIFESRGSTGLWRADLGASTFTQIDSTDSTSDTIAALPDGGLFVNRKLAGDTHYSGWYWNGGIGMVKIIPDTTSIFMEGIGKDGDIFFNSTTAGTGYWSLYAAYHALSGNTEYPDFLTAQR